MDEPTWRYVRWMLALVALIVVLGVFNMWMWFRG